MELNVLLGVNEVAKRVVKVIFVNGACIQPKFGLEKSLYLYVGSYFWPWSDKTNVKAHPDLAHLYIHVHIVLDPTALGMKQLQINYLVSSKCICSKQSSNKTDVSFKYWQLCGLK